jgi:predicted metalloprotease
MRWQSGRRSDNVEDRRGMRVRPAAAAGGGLGMIALVLVALFLGIDPSVLLQGGGAPQMEQAPAPQTRAPAAPGQDPARDFVAVVLADTEDTWRELFRQAGRTYQDPKLVLFENAVESACGFAQAAVGPFYCPLDQKVYLDLSFFRDLRERFRAPGDFAQAYVIAHEIGHHVQTLLGISQKVMEMRQRADQARANALSVRQELQADCLAGVWANHANRTRQILETGDVEEALGAATAIGDDRLQRQSRGYVAPETFTHGSSAQRVRWFKQGLTSGSLRECDTFATDKL